MTMHADRRRQMSALAKLTLLSVLCTACANLDDPDAREFTLAASEVTLAIAQDTCGPDGAVTVTALARNDNPVYLVPTVTSIVHLETGRYEIIGVCRSSLDVDGRCESQDCPDCIPDAVEHTFAAPGSFQLTCRDSQLAVIAG